MLLVLSTYGFASVGGSETYLLTVAQQLDRLGHAVALHAKELGKMAHIARERGVAVSSDEDMLPERPDAVLVQDRVTSLELADRYPDVPQLFMCHADAVDLQLPPQLPGIVSAAVVFNERVAERIGALSERPQIVRMRQPIDIDWFTPAGPTREQPRRALILSNYMRGPRRGLVEEACRAAGLELTHVGAHGTAMDDPRGAILDADVVFGYGRSALEAMACGRATYVLDHKGGDGWVTPQRYAALEADGFGGRAFASPLTVEQMRSDLADYRPEMGVANRDLVVRHHAAHRQAAGLVELLRSLPRREPVEDYPLRELARLARLEWRARAAASSLAYENETLREELGVALDAAAERQLLLDSLTRTRRYRVGAALARPLDRWRVMRDRLRRHG